MKITDERSRIRDALCARADRRQRLAPELRARAATYAHRRKSEGATAAAIAGELGVSQPTVARWLETTSWAAAELAASVASPSLREVVVESSGTPGLSVASPRGFRVEGLSLEQAAMILRALG